MGEVVNAGMLECWNAGISAGTSVFWFADTQASGGGASVDGGGSDAEGGEGGGGQEDQEAKKRRRIFIVLAIIGVLGYVVMGIAMARGGGSGTTTPGSDALGERASAWIKQLTGVKPDSLTVAYKPERPFRWQQKWRFELDADEVCTITVPAQDSKLFDNRSLGLRLHPGEASVATTGDAAATGAVGAAGATTSDDSASTPPSARIVYTLPNPNDPRVNSDLKDKLVGSDNALVLPRKPQDGEQKPDLLAGTMTLMMCAGTLTITNTAGAPIVVEVY
jgi:hypothetical protein